MPSIAQAIELLGGDSSNTTEILTDKGILCDQEGRQCITEGNIQVTRGKSVLTCRKLIAHFGKSEVGKQELQMLEAFGDVHIYSQEDDYDAKGSYCQYAVKDQLLTLSGHPVIRHQTSEIYGTGDIVYHQLKNMAITTNRATVKKEDKLMQADVLIAYFTTEQKDDKEKKNLDHILAEGNVIISTPEEIARGDYGNYHEKSQIAELWDNVVITRCDGQLRGQRARVDIDTGHSRMVQESKDPKVESRAQGILISKQRNNT